MTLLNRPPKKPTKSRRGLRLGTISAARSAAAIFRSKCFKTAVRSPGSDGFAGSANRPRRRQTIKKGLGVAIAGGEAQQLPAFHIGNIEYIRSIVTSGFRFHFQALHSTR